MKFFANIILFLFLTFLAAPTLVSLLEDDNDTGIVYSVSDEEMHKDIKEVKAITQTVYEIAFTPNFKRSSLIQSKNEPQHNTVCGDIFLPPPEFL